MRILLLAPMVPEPDGAGAIPIMLHAELVALGQRHDVTFVTAAGDEPGEAEAAAELADSGLDVHIADRSRPPPGIDRWRRRWRLAATWARGRWPWRTVWFADPAVQAVLDRLAATRRFDLTVVEDSSMAVFSLPAGVPSVLTEHEVRRPRAIDWRVGPPSTWPRWAFRELDWRRWRRFQREAWRRFDLVQVFGERDAAAIAELAPEVAARVRVNPFGLALPSAADPARELPGTVLFVGNFTHPPNRAAAVWLAREILPVVRARHPQVQLQLVGTSPRDEVLELAGPGVEVVGDAPSVQPHLEAAAVVLAPVQSGGGMRMKVLQAMAAGKPVVTTSRGAEGFDTLDLDLPLLLAESRDEFAEAIVALLEDDRRRRELGGRAREFAERHHSPGAWGARLERVFEEARDKAPPR